MTKTTRTAAPAAANAAKHITTDTVLLFERPEEAANSTVRVPAGTPVETDGQQIFCRVKGGGELSFVKCKVGKDVGYILANRVTAA